MPARSPVSQWRTTVRAPVSATATKDSSPLSATPLAKASPSRTTSGLPPGRRRSRRPVRVSWTKSSFQRSRPYRVEESENHTVPSVRDRRVVAEDHRGAVDPVGDRLDAAARGVDAEHAAAGVADQQPAVEVELEAERPAAGVRDAVDAPAVVADPEDAAVLGAGEDGALVAALRAHDDVLGTVGGDGDDLE